MPEIVRVAISVPLRQLFDYSLPPSVPLAQIRPGMRVRVPFGRTEQIGIVWEVSDRPFDPNLPLKSIAEVLDDVPLLRADDLFAIGRAAEYYHHPLGEVLEAALPALLRRGRRIGTSTAEHRLVAAEVDAAQIRVRGDVQRAVLAASRAKVEGLSEAELRGISAQWRHSVSRLVELGLVRWIVRDAGGHAGRMAERTPASMPELTPAQGAAVEAVHAAIDRFAVFLLDGVTGSGKTEVYLRSAQPLVQQGRQVLVLVPEIGLTPQLYGRFAERFPENVAVYHSGLAEGQRLKAWETFRAGRVGVLVGTRSAAFAPMARPGLILVDEEHDTSFRQLEGFRYSARDFLLMRAQRLQIPVVLGSATPSLESLHNANIGRFQHLKLPDRAAGLEMPAVRLLRLSSAESQTGLSMALAAAIETALQNSEQTLLFLNRRGFAPTVLCQACAWVAPCPRCDTRLVYHAGERVLRCHRCDFRRAIPSRCDACGGSELIPLGLGTERIESLLEARFPGARIVRIDRDATRHKGELEKRLAAVHERRADIVLGTQMLAKGHHFDGVSLVGILDADAGLFSADLRGAERMAQLLVQVAGRAGRGRFPGTVIVQTRFPEHPVLQTILRSNYGEFAVQALTERRALHLPPFAYLALLRAEANAVAGPQRLLGFVAEWIVARVGDSVQALGPVAAPVARVAGKHRQQLLLQAARRAPLHQALSDLLPELEKHPEARRVRWSLEVDPLEFD